MAIDPFSRRALTPDEWRVRAARIQSELDGLTADELMRGRASSDGRDDSVGRNPSGYDPTQPRVPAGHSDGGQWTDEAKTSAGASINDSRVLSDTVPENQWIPGAQDAGDGHHFPPRAVWQNWPL
jgi:hypothetical protein